MHFTYIDRQKFSNDLMQGDILQITPELDDILRTYHPHYSANKANIYFIILTQSCDLNRSFGETKSRYITIAAVRSLSYLKQNQISSYQEKDLPLETPIPFCSEKSKNKIDQFFVRLLNNNEDEYFYLHKESLLDFPEDCCAFLRLSIPIKIMHYEICLKAKILELTEGFRAKLGWKVGQIYSRIGTDDWDSGALRTKVNEILKDSAIWVNEKELLKVKTAIAKWKELNTDKHISERDIQTIISKLPKKKDDIMEQIKFLLLEAKALKTVVTNDDERKQLVNRLVDVTLKPDMILTNLMK